MIWPVNLGPACRALIALSLVGPAASAYADSDGDSLRLDVVEQRVLQNNADIAAARNMEAAAFLQARGTGRWDDPMLMVGFANLPTSLSFREDMMTMTMIGLSQALPLFGQKRAERRVAERAAESVVWQRRIMEREMIAMARQTFVEAYTAQQRVYLQQEQLALAQQVAGAAQSLVVTNRADQSDLLAAEAQVQRERIALAQATQSAEARRRDLAALLGDTVISGPLATPSVAPPPLSVDSWQRSALSNDPTLALKTAEADRFSAQAEAERAMGRPMLALSGSYGIRLDSEMEKRDNMLGAQLSLSVPIFSRGARKNMAAGMLSMRAQAEDERTQLVRARVAQIADLHSRAAVLDSSRSRYRGDILPLTEEAFRSSLTGYAAGRTSLSRLLDDARAVIRDHQTLLDLERAYYMTIIAAERYTAESPNDLSRQSTGKYR